MRRILIGVLLGFVAIGITAPDSPMAQKSANGREKVRLQWAFAALKDGPRASRLVAVNREETLSTGDEFKMLLELKETCYAYVIYQGPMQEIRLLFPYELSDFEKGIEESIPYYIPKDHGWFELDDQKGPMKFHLVVSDERLTKLEELFGKYESARNEVKRNAARELLAELQDLQRLNTSLKAPAERPAQIVGRTRGAGEPGSADEHDIRSLAVEISAEKFFSRTFTIDHK
jgi:hypothetical protein